MYNKYINVRKGDCMYKESISRGLRKGISTTWELTKVIVPVYFFVTFLKYTPILNWISDFFTPVMKIFGLPGEASLPLVLGNMLNLYAGIGAIAGLNLEAKQITIIAFMLSFSHSLFMETAVVKKTGMNVFIVLACRFSLAIISGIVLNLVL